MSPSSWDRRWFIAAALLVMAGATFYFLPRPAEEAVEVDEAPVKIDDGPPERREFRLYFPGGDGRLHVQSRELAVSPETNDNVARLVEALLAGPHGEHAPAGTGDETDGTGTDSKARPKDAPAEPPDDLWPPFPAGVALGRTYLLDDATVVLDLTSPDRGAPSTGSKAELLMLYSLVNTVLLNVEEAKRVVVLWNGQQPNTFAGHVDATRPFEAASELIAEGES